MKNRLLIGISVCLGLILAACTGPEPGDLTGGGTETETYGIMGRIVGSDGQPAPDAAVRLLPLTYIPGDQLTGPSGAVYTTNQFGHFMIPGAEKGWYGTVARDTAGNASYCRFNLAGANAQDTLFVLPADTLLPTGTINGVVRFPALFPLDRIDIALQGLDRDRVQATDSLPAFSIDSIPAGSYTLVTLPLSSVTGATFPKFAGIDISPDSATVLDTIDLGFLDSLITW